jgi:AcrR family transcriptional regulator
MAKQELVHGRSDDRLTTHEAADPSTMNSSPTSARRSGRRPRADGESTRARVIQAVTECILEKGYYQASSNDIARRAGVTWGTIQYQFESREGLLLEVLNAAWNELREQIRSAHISGDTLENRLESLLEVLATHYSRPEHLAHLQILLDLNHDPRSSAISAPSDDAAEREMLVSGMAMVVRQRKRQRRQN